jgi:hypothetical protein
MTRGAFNGSARGGRLALAHARLVGAGPIALKLTESTRPFGRVSTSAVSLIAQTPVDVPVPVPVPVPA